MAVPGQDERDWAFAEAFGLPIVRTVQPPDGWQGKAFVGEGPAVNSANAEVDLNGLGVADAKRRIIDWLEATGAGTGTVTTRLRDWLFSRQRFWGEPFPIVYDPDDGLPRAAAGVDAAGGPPRSRGLLAQDLRRRRRDLRTGAAAGPGDRLGRGDAGPGRGPEDLPPRDQHHAAVGRVVLVRAALPRPHQRAGAGRPRERALLDGPAVRGRLRRRRPVRRRGRARRAAPAVRPLLAQGALRPRATSPRSSRTGGWSTRA